ncbi:MAG: class I tRNA ligase family protein [bacterium]|nr:class I tRNA ligase family protein [bacterium]
MAENNFWPKSEEKILKFWKDRKIFERSLINRKGKAPFVFFEGPPTANGRPGIHHFIGRVFKDLFARYKTMRGFLVERKGGWDTHGLPVEIEVEKELGLSNKKEVKEYGIAEFNKKAKQSVWKYKEEWERFTDRIGFWINLDEPYITYDRKYMETLWWIISGFDKKGFLYRGHKVLPWCPRCGTGLSSHEVAQGYRDVTEASVFVKFKLKPGQGLGGANKTDGNTYVLAWTTTPWTLPGNVALAIGEKIKYAIVRRGNERLITAKESIPSIKTGEVMDIETEIKGKDLSGLEYEPLFEIKALKSSKSYKIYPADFVSTEEGTGVVHTAVMYGEDDYELGKKLGLPTHHTVDEEGNFTADVKGFEGRYVKKADTDIIEYLKNKNLLYKTLPYTHSYPFCWRCKNPLLYYAKNSWFIAMSKVKKKLIQNNNKVNWVPDHLKQGRFGEFLKDLKDWAFSRERFWGTPLPVWRCNKCEATRVIGSLAELEQYRYKSKNNLYTLRHGFSEKNGHSHGEELTASRLEHDKYNLTPEGIEQVEKTLSALKKKGGVDAIYSSPFKRTKQSADIIAKAFGLKVHIDERLKELDQGIVCEGKPRSECVLEYDSMGMDDKHGGDGETWHETRSRMFSAIKEIDSKHEGKNILFVSHGDPLWLLDAALLGLSDKETIEQRDMLYHKQGGLKDAEVNNYPYNEMGEIDMHRPYVDEIFLKCAKCNGKMSRVEDVVDVWFDSGSMPFAQWHYPFDNKKKFNDNFPADFISEGIDQTRGWFYTLLAVSSLLGRGEPYKNVLSYGHVLDEKGKKMSKSVGNVVNPWEIIEQFGADAGRWYFYTVNNPGEPKLFNINDVKKKLNSFIMTVLNSIRFLELYSDGNNKLINDRPASILDKWIMSRLSGLSHDVSSKLDEYDLMPAARAIEDFVVNDLSNWWLRRSRSRFQKPAGDKELGRALAFYRHILVELSKIMAPFTPFLADHIYKKISTQKESVHLEDWPKFHKKEVDDELEQKMTVLRHVVAEGLAQRKIKSIRVRQPLASISIKLSKPKEGASLMPFGGELEALLKEELNIKKVIYNTIQEEAVVLDADITPKLAREGYAREVMRYFQDMRKDAGYKFDDKIFAGWESADAGVREIMSQFEGEIKEAVLIDKLEEGKRGEVAFDIEKEFELGPNMKLWLGVKK